MTAITSSRLRNRPFRAPQKLPLTEAEYKVNDLFLKENNKLQRALSS